MGLPILHRLPWATVTSSRRPLGRWQRPLWLLSVLGIGWQTPLALALTTNASVAVNSTSALVTAPSSLSVLKDSGSWKSTKPIAAPLMVAGNAIPQQSWQEAVDDDGLSLADDIPEEDGADNFEDDDGHIGRIYAQPLPEAGLDNADYPPISNLPPKVVKPVDSRMVITQNQGSQAENASVAELNSSAESMVAQIPLNAISPLTLKTFVEVIDLVRREYVEPVSDEVLFNDAMSGMLTKLDSHAEFLDAEAYQNLRAFTQGDVGEVGIQASYQQSQGHWVVTAVTPNSPAAEERIRVGDYIHQINETKLTERKTANDVEQLLSGIAGSQVELVVSREGRRKRTVMLQRNQTRQQQIEVKLQEGIAIVRLPVFQNNSRQKLLVSLAQLNQPVAGIVLDVRDNPGGVLESAIDIAGLFMAEKTAVQVKGRQGIERTLTTGNNALLANIPVIILQNRYSASAAEVLASSLQTQKRARVVGETSYGKGSVQSVIPVNDEQAIKLTVAYYLTADGRQIDDIGITPDISLSGDEAMWEQQAVTLLLAEDLPPGVSFVLKEPD